MMAEANPEPIEILDGEATAVDWACGGYRFRRVENYETQARRLPQLAGKRNGMEYDAIDGEHVVTFLAEAILPEAQRDSRWLKGGSSLHDVLLLWSFVGGLRVYVKPIKHPPTSDERSYALADADEIENAVTQAYRACRLRAVSRRTYSALLTYLEIAHVRPMQVKAVLIASVLECLAPISAPADADDGARYRPIIDRLAALPSVAEHGVERDAIEALIVELYRIRNGFLHGGVHPYREDINLGEVTTTTGRIVSGARRLAKLAVAQALGVPKTWTTDALTNGLKTLFTNGSFVPSEVERVLRALDGDDH